MKLKGATNGEEERRTEKPGGTSPRDKLKRELLASREEVRRVPKGERSGQNPSTPSHPKAGTGEALRVISSHTATSNLSPSGEGPRFHQGSIPVVFSRMERVCQLAWELRHDLGFDWLELMDKLEVAVDELYEPKKNLY